MAPAIVFHEPPAALRTGGLDTALRSLERYLREQGREVLSHEGYHGNPPRAAAHHFHGLWRFEHWRTASLLRRRRIPYAVSPHGMLEPWAWNHKRWKKWPYFWLVERSLLRGAASIVATSELEAEHLRPFIAQSRVRTIPLGLPDESRRENYKAARAELGWPLDETVLLFLSRIDPKKGLDILIDGLAKADLSRGPKPCRLIIVGEGAPSYESSLRETARRLASKLPAVEWAGPIWDDRKWLYLQAADLFCLPSHSENFGLVALEALQVGTPSLVSSNTPWKIVEEWRAGYVVDTSPRSIAEVLRRFLSDARWTLTDRSRLSAAIHERFGWSAVGPRYLELYDGLINEERRRAS